MRVAFCAAAVVALTCLLLRAGRTGMAGDYVDPIARIGAQDEALYAHSAIQMAQRGGWLTPVFLGRYGLYKPPLLAAAAGLSARILGVTRLALRLPVALLAALAAGLVLWWAAEVHSWQAGVCAAALLISNHLWHSLASMCLTDGLLAAFDIAAMYCLFADPWLEEWWALWGFAGAVAGAILTKSVAGVLPLAMLGLYWIAAPRNRRPKLRRVVLATALALALAAPWFVYQLAVHGRWFWAEHIRVEVLGHAAGVPPQTEGKGHAAFYLSRLVLLDPVLLAMAAAAVFPFLQEIRRRSAHGVLLLIWLAVPLAAACGWGLRSVAYLLPAIPAMAILAAAYNPLCSGRSAKWMLALVAAAFLAKAAVPAAPWGLSFTTGTRVAEAPLLSAYCERERGNDLVLVDSGDEWYASLLPLSKVRYMLRGASAPGGKYGLDFAAMGIILNADQFADLAHWTPVFQQRLREWGLDSTEPVGTVIFASSVEDVARLVRAHPESDFFLPQAYRAALAQSATATHDMVAVPADHILLLSRQAIAAPPHLWSCRL
jgi:hypothetical protein